MNEIKPSLLRFQLNNRTDRDVSTPKLLAKPPKGQGQCGTGTPTLKSSFQSHVNLLGPFHGNKDRSYEREEEGEKPTSLATSEEFRTIIVEAPVLMEKIGP